MAHKLKATLMVFVHTVLSFLAAFVAGFTFYAFWRPVIGHERYYLVARSPGIVILVLIVVAFWGLAIYARWHDHRAFFAWVLPAVFTFHFVLSRGLTAVLGPYPWWADAFIFLEIGAAYSAGAVLGAVVTVTMSARPVT
jgi:hypothetical protein